MLNDKPLKLVDQFLYLGSNISSIENDVNTRIEKAWTVTDKLSIIRKSNYSDKKSPWFLPRCVHVGITVSVQHLDSNKTRWEKARLELIECTFFLVLK